MKGLGLWRLWCLDAGHMPTVCSIASLTDNLPRRVIFMHVTMRILCQELEEKMRSLFGSSIYFITAMKITSIMLNLNLIFFGPILSSDFYFPSCSSSNNNNNKRFTKF